MIVTNDDRHGTGASHDIGCGKEGSECHSHAGKCPSDARAVIRYARSSINFVLSPLQLIGSPTNMSQKNGTSTASPRGSAFPRPCKNTGLCRSSRRCSTRAAPFSLDERARTINPLRTDHRIYDPGVLRISGNDFVCPADGSCRPVDNLLCVVFFEILNVLHIAEVRRRPALRVKSRMSRLRLHSDQRSRRGLPDRCRHLFQGSNAASSNMRASPMANGFTRKAPTRMEVLS